MNNDGIDAPLRITSERVWLYGGGLIIVNFSALAAAWLYHEFRDWPGFVQAGSLVGTHDLIRVNGGFMYAPGFAYLFTWASLLPVGASFAVYALLMGGLAFACSKIAANSYGLPTTFAALATFAWGPVAASVNFAQTAIIGLLLVLLLASALTRHKPIPAGVAAGLLLFKPTYALPFLILLVARREWKALALVALCAVGWYLLSASATNSWTWPLFYAEQLRTYFANDFAANSPKAASAVALLVRAGLSPTLGIAFSFTVLLLCVPLLAKAAPLDAVSFTALLAVVLSPHAWYYDAALALPALYLAMKVMSEPPRTWVLAACYLLGTGWLVTGVLGFDLVALVTIGITCWFLFREVRAQRRRTL